MLKVYSMILSMMSAPERRKFYIILGLVFVLSLFEAASVFSILPFLQVLSDPEMIRDNRVFAKLYSWGSFTSDRSFTSFLGVTAFCITVFGLIFKAMMVWVLTRFSMMRSYRLSSRLLSGYLHQPYIWFLSRHSSDLGNTVLSEVDQMVSGALLPAMRLIPDVLTASLIITVLFYFEPEVAISAALLLGGAYVGIYFFIRRILLRIGETRVAMNKARFHIVQEATGGIKELKLMGLEEGFLARFRSAALRMARAQTKGLVLAMMPRYLLEALAYGGMILLILVLMARGDGGLSGLLPTLGLLAVAGMRLLPALQQIYNKVANIRYAQNTLERIHADISALDPGIPIAQKNANGLPRLHLRKELELRDAKYSYPNTNSSALHGMSMKIRANTTVGIVGGTGAGKTTLVDIILGLLRQDAGQILLDGQELAPDKIRAWQKSLGYVPQQIFLSDDTVAANIAFGVPTENIDMAAVEAAAQAASLHSFVTTSLPQGYQTAVGERGVRLSGGQRQRIGIARALYHNPDVLIMDEATSALDNVTERAVMEAVQNISGSRTIIMIAHRLTTVKNCDEIFLLRDGKVGAQGTFNELMAQDEGFREMARGI